MSWLDICGDESANGGFLAELNKRAPMVGRFQLPTEAQWEYACRAGTTGAYAGDLDEMGWYRGNSGSKTYPVGQKKPNTWGLHDMHGNVSEWCADWRGDYDMNEMIDPSGPASGSYRVLRGGDWVYSAAHCRAADRYGGNPTISSSSVGFRLARSSVP